MDTLNHSTIGYLTLAIPTSYLLPPGWSIAVGTLGAVMGAIPDVVGELYALDIDINTKYFKWKKKGDGYLMYNRLHKGEFWWLNWFPTYWLHTKLDSYCHSAGKRWYPGKLIDYLIPWKYRERMWLETLMWGIAIVLGVWCGL